MSNTQDTLVIDTDAWKKDLNASSLTHEQIELFELVPNNHSALSKVLPEFDFANPAVDPNKFASSLVETCKKHNGYGLSANQCGYEHRVFVMGAGDNYVAHFNPKIISTRGEIHLAEGCLSFRNLFLNITRAESIDVEYQDFTGAVKTATYVGMTARCFLHELDHLNGIVFTSKAKPLALKQGKKKQEKVNKLLKTYGSRLGDLQKMVETNARRTAK